MSDGVLIQDSTEIPYRNIAFIRGVIAGDVAPRTNLQPGDARLVVDGREFFGSVIEIANGEAVFSSARLEEIVRVLDPNAPDPQPVDFAPMTMNPLPASWSAAAKWDSSNQAPKP